MANRIVFILTVFANPVLKNIEVELDGNIKRVEDGNVLFVLVMRNDGGRDGEG